MHCAMRGMRHRALALLLFWTAALTYLLPFFGGGLISYTGVALGAAAGYAAATLTRLRVPTWVVVALGVVNVVVFITAMSQYEDDSCCNRTFDTLIFIAVRPLPLLVAAAVGITVGQRRLDSPHHN
jgi:hypothetical protein